MTGEDPRIVISGENTLESEYTITIDNGIEVLTSGDFLYAIFYLFASSGFLTLSIQRRLKLSGRLCRQTYLTILMGKNMTTKY